MTNLIQVLKQIAPLTEQDCERLMSITKSVQLNKGDLLTEAGKKNNVIAFVDEGYLRRFYMKNGEEITDFFYFKNEISADLPSLIAGTLPHASIVAMEQTTLTLLPYDEFNELFKTVPALEHLYRLMVQYTFVRFYNRTMAFILKSPTERYNDLLAASPQTFQNAAPHHIASYMGMSLQQFNSLRTEI